MSIAHINIVSPPSTNMSHIATDTEHAKNTLFHLAA